MKVKTSEATKLQLDWGLARALGYTPVVKKDPFNDRVYVDVTEDTESQYVGFFHTDPAVCMGLIEGWKINVKHIHYSTSNRAVLACWGSALDDSGYMQAFGSTVAEAVARCVIAMRLGDEFECPSELRVMS